MTGDCSAMQEQSCVLDALTQNTYQCLVPGQSYYVQVFTPLVKNTVQVTGTIDLKLSAIKHADTCSPLANCLASANFTTQFDCTRDDSVQFINFSTYGTSINYLWDFGYNGQTSAAVSPSFFYPALPADQTYTVKLIVTNSSCSKIDSVSRTITIPGRPYANLGADIVQCNRNAAPVVLRAASHPGATYLWQNNSMADSLVVTASGNNNYWVRISYNGCISTDTIRILKSLIAARPLQQINLCGDSVLVDVRRGFGETYRWNTGAVTRSIYMSTPGYYWADISYFDCVYRDSFKVNNVAVYNPLGNDTIICLFNAGYILNAETTGAITYTWQNNSTADSLLVTVPGQYYVSINLGNCTIKDTVNILGYPAPLTVITDTSICAGASFFLPWGPAVKTAGTYSDTTQNTAGCDSLIQRITLSVKAKPDIGNDSNFCSLPNGYTLDATTTGAVSYTWQDGSTGAFYNVTQAGLYIVQANFGSCTAVDSVNIKVLSSPATVSTDTSICAGKTIILPGGLAVQNAGTYKDTLRSILGCDSLIRIYKVMINPRPLLGNDTSVNSCSGNSINLTGYFNTTGLNSNWTVNNITVINPAAVNVQGNYSLIATNTNGCSDTTLLSLTINSKPQLGNDTAISACNGTSFNLTNIYNTTGLTAIWTQNNIPVANATAVNINGTYQLLARSAAGCTDTALVTLNFNGNPVIVINNPVTRCIPKTINLTAPAVTSGSTAGVTFTYWQDSIAGTAYIDAATATDGTYYIKGTSSNGCFSIKPVTVKSYPVQAVNAGNDIGICDNDSVAMLTVTVTNTTAPVTYQWEPFTAGIIAPALSSTLVKPTVTPQQYTISVTDGYGCNYVVSDTIIVSKQPPVKAFAGNDTIASVGLPHQLNATGGINFIWSPRNLLNNPFIANPLATIYTDSVLFAVEVKDALGCTGYDSIKIKTYNGITYYVPNAFSPNGDGWNDVFRPVPVGIVSTESFRIYNRYGQLMFETSQLSKGWDGTYKGKAQPVANYVWLLKGKGRNGKTIEMKGNVVLVR
jgi:gliding motility-associated-like protein